MVLKRKRDEQGKYMWVREDSKVEVKPEPTKEEILEEKKDDVAEKIKKVDTTKKKRKK